MSVRAARRLARNWRAADVVPAPITAGDIEAIQFANDCHRRVRQEAIRYAPLLDLLGCDDTRAAIHCFFGTDCEHHCFGVERHGWLSVIETQITTGLRHFLTDGTPHRQRQRVAALLSAAFQSVPIERLSSEMRRIFVGGQVGGRDLSAIHVMSEEQAPQRGATRARRVDLLIRAETSGTRIGCVIEAKLGHGLTAGQLSAYRRHAEKEHQLTAANCAFLVIAPRLNRALRRETSRGGADWLALPWSRFILRYDRALATEDDDSDFRRFRRTIWDRTQ